MSGQWQKMKALVVPSALFALGASSIAPLAACGGNSANSPGPTAGAGGAVSDAGGAPGAAGLGPSACGAELQFEDPLVEAAVRSAAHVSTGAISAASVAAVAVVSVADGAASLSGLECLPALTTIIAQNGTIEDLSPLANAMKLRGVSLSNNHITDLGPLSRPATYAVSMMLIQVENNQIASTDSLSLPPSKCAEIMLGGNPLMSKDVQRFCDEAWHVSWGSTQPYATCGLACTK